MSMIFSRSSKNHASNHYLSPRQKAQTAQAVRLPPKEETSPQHGVSAQQNSVPPSRNNAEMRRLGIFLGTLGGAVLLCLLLGFGLYRGYQFCINSEYFSISSIEVNGIHQLDYADVLKISGLQKGDNSLSVRISEMEGRLLQNPWVEAVSIRRQLPGSFTINIQERVPQFWVLRNGTLHYLDQNGLLIAPVQSKNFRSLPTLDIGPGGEDAIPHLGAFMTQLKEKKLPFDLAQISWLRISAGKGFELYWENKHLSLSIGLENWQENLKHLALVIYDIEKRKEIRKTREIYAADGQVWLHKA